MTIETAKMSNRGQIIIPKEIRKEVRAERNTIFAVSAIDKNTIIMRKIDRDALLEDFRKIRQKSLKMEPNKIDKVIHETRRTRH